MSIEDRQQGEAIRRAVMGDEFVDRALGNASEFDQPLQDLVMENAWGGPWTRDDLPRATRSLVTIAMLIALKAPNELKGHVRGALRNGASKEEIRAVILQATAYCGFPAALEAMRAAREVIDSWED
ncbi:carboxymuconolactone decarboxylase family protein [Pseudomaricurvus sp. HS19]|uniref:carboxymuconolactone decarboxylase family protein n=1 Tax=Pseudomaricurvus sp. HS19 TaxID=2692626 RepID=UPI00136EEA3B|nr:carboxymuconolactone decarboxylase family protein [Pseudomaricurvus sp. HS19]MYM62528.1 4-carboxymuconolactone decarboxylase [Pseudomaricurvus sp. HS19]